MPVLWGRPLGAEVASKDEAREGEEKPERASEERILWHRNEGRLGFGGGRERRIIVGV